MLEGLPEQHQIIPPRGALHDGPVNVAVWWFRALEYILLDPAAGGDESVFGVLTKHQGLFAVEESPVSLVPFDQVQNREKAAGEKIQPGAEWVLSFFS